MGAAPETNARPLYARVAYAKAFGFSAINLEEWKTAVLTRPIPGSSWQDALGCYPLSLIDADANLSAGLECLRAAGLVSVALVPDPVTGPSPRVLAEAFSICRPFKTHYLLDRGAGEPRFATTHRQMIRKALKHCTIAPVQLRDVLDDWGRLYAGLVTQRKITGLQCFGPEYFAALAEMPEIVALAAFRSGRIVAMALWACGNDVVYSHLAASAAEGYEVQAMYGLFAEAIERFRESRVVHFGGGAGLNNDPDDGLAYFKKGFANRDVTAYFCGSCLNPARYRCLAAGEPETSFFPAYRRP